MRRNNRGGRGGNRGMGHQKMNSGGGRSLMASSGPLGTDQLQLRELDLELALLKRKRQIIEEQHNMLVTESQGFNRVNPFGFNQPSYGQQEPTRNFNELYSDTSRRGFGSSSRPAKRPAIDPWDNSAPGPKRFTGPPRRKPNQGFREQKPKPARPQAHAPSPSRSAPRAEDKPSGKFRPNFRQNKVTKSKPTPAPNKLNSLPVAERKNLVEKSSELVKKPIVTYVLEADRPIHPKLVGRLELALGGVMREMREALGALPEHEETFLLGARQRSLKQAVRERIREVMLGKSVGVNAEIIAAYRSAYPKDTDIALLNQIREANRPTSELAIKILQQDNPERYFKANFCRLLTSSLNEMFERLKMLYAQEAETKKPLHEIVNNILKDLENKIPEDDKNKVLEASVEGTEEAEKEPTEVNGANNQDSVEDASKQEETTDADKTQVEEADITDDTGEIGDANKSEGTSTEQNTPAISTVVESSEVKLLSVTKFYQRLIDTYLRKNLPSILPKYKEYIVEILDVNEAYKNTEAYIIRSTNQKAQRSAGKDIQKESTVQDVVKVEPMASPPVSKKVSDKPESKSDRHIYFVKIVGKPGLPRKKVMKVFLDSYEPTLIKKHRNIHNILFVSFDKQENYDSILAQNGHVLDSKKLDIKPSEKINKNKPQGEQNEEEQSQDQSANLNDTVLSDTNETFGNETNEGGLEEVIQTANINDPVLSDGNDSFVNESGLEKIEPSNFNDPVLSDVNETFLDEKVLEKVGLGSLDDQIDDLLCSLKEEKGNVGNGDADGNVEEANDVQNKPEENAGSEAENVQNGGNQSEGAENTKEPPQQEAGKPTRASTRLATAPSTPRTRRASKLPQN